MLGVLAFTIVLVLLTSYICFYIAFYVPDKKRLKEGEFSLPFGDDYAPYEKQMRDWVKELSTIPHEDFYIKSFDGLTVHAKYYEFNKGAPKEIMFHGYRGNATRDLCGGVQRCFKLGYNALIVDQRASGRSEGKVITFGIKESKDCLSWVNFAVEKFGTDAKLLMTGISMGATTVMIASSYELPKNVVGVIADCGFTSAKDIIIKCVKGMKLSPKIFYPFIKLGARIYGKFNLEEISPKQALRTAKVPVMFFHGETDGFVPATMSKENYEVCVAPKKLVIIQNTGHGMAYLTEPETYLRELKEFEKTLGIN